MVYLILMGQQTAPQLFKKAYEGVIASWVSGTAEIKQYLLPSVLGGTPVSGGSCELPHPIQPLARLS